MRGRTGDKSFARRNWHWFLAATFAGYLTLDYAFIGGWFVRPPGEKDERLVGQWQGKAKIKVEGFRFFPNGSGEFYSPWNKSTRSFAWGTESGKLATTVTMNDYVGLARYSYSLSDDGNQLRLEPTERGFSPYFPRVLNRAPNEK